MTYYSHRGENSLFSRVKHTAITSFVNFLLSIKFCGQPEFSVQIFGVLQNNPVTSLLQVSFLAPTFLRSTKSNLTAVSEDGHYHYSIDCQNGFVELNSLFLPLSCMFCKSTYEDCNQQSCRCKIHHLLRGYVLLPSKPLNLFAVPNSITSVSFLFFFFEINNKFVISKPGGKAIDVLAEVVLDSIQIFRGCESY